MLFCVKRIKRKTNLKIKKMKSNRTQLAPTTIEDLGDNTFYYNFDVVEETKENEETIYNYQQVRCNYPLNLEEIKAALISENYNHKITNL